MLKYFQPISQVKLYNHLMQHTSLLQVPQLQSNLLKATELLPFLVLSFYTTLMQTFQNEKGSDHVLFLHKDYFPPPSPH